jgi:hypothetical protein
MNWGKSIILAFALFAVFILALVVVCARQSMPLVSSAYYRDELVYQQQIDRIDNTRRLAVLPAVRLRHNELVISYSDFASLDSASIRVFCPSDEHLDREFKLTKGSETEQVISIDDMPGGFYKIRMTWAMKGKEYFIETLANL